MTLPRARTDVVFRQLDDEWVIFDPTADRLHALNLTAALVWAHLDGSLDPPAIARAVAAAFDPPPAVEAIAADVVAVIERFRAEGLLQS